jgi:hypothetical protein
MIALCVAAVACKSAAARQADELEGSVSWLSTVQEVGRAWSENRVPARYAERTFDEARASLVKAGQGDAARRVIDVTDVLRKRDRERLPNALDALDVPRDQLQQKLESLKRPQ